MEVIVWVWFFIAAAAAAAPIPLIKLWTKTAKKSGRVAVRFRGLTVEDLSS